MPNSRCGLLTLTQQCVFKYTQMERDSRRIVKRLLADGFVLVSVKGSHHKYARHEGDCVRTVIVPHPKRDLPTGTARAIARQAGWIE